jgi:transcription termination/antitermination protein NusA
MSEISKSIQIICDEKGLDASIVMEAVEQALGAAYRKDFGNRQMNIKTKFDPETGDMEMWDVKTVVEDVSEEALEQAQEELSTRREAAQKEGKELTDEDVEDLPRFNPKLEIMLTEAKAIKKKVKVAEVLEIELEIPGDFGRMAAQTAKQVIIQKLREAERNSVFEDFKGQEGKIVQGVIQRRDRGGAVIIDLGKITGLLAQTEQIPREFYKAGARMRFYVISVALGNRGPEIMLSRIHNDMVRVVFEQEIPEVANSEVEIKGIARDAGNRSKVAVWTNEDSIDPIGSCIGQRGSRITTIIDELGGEKIDVIQYHEDVPTYIKEALSPAKVNTVELNEKEKLATVHVAEDQFSLAIGRGGQNVRLAAALTGWQINVVQLGEEEKAVSSEDDAENIEDVSIEKKEDSEEEKKVESADELAVSESTEVEEKKEEEAA